MLQKQYIQNLEEYRLKNKNSFKNRKKNIIKSLEEVECFLCNWKKISKGIKLYNILKRS